MLLLVLKTWPPCPDHVVPSGCGSDEGSAQLGGGGDRRSSLELTILGHLLGVTPKGVSLQIGIAN